MARIPYDRTADFGKFSYLIAQRLAVVQADLGRVLDEMNAITAGGTQTALLETPDPASNPTAVRVDQGKQFGVMAGKGQAFYDAHQSIKAAILAAGARLQATIDLDQG